MTIKKVRGKPPGNCVNSSEGGISPNKVGDLIYQVLSGQLSTVVNEIIVEVELSDND